MSHIRKNFIARNDGFVCESCGAQVPPARGTFRNHCPQCLTSKHVDGAVPGDRSATCKGLMPALSYEGTDPSALDLIHKCVRCNKVARNRIAEDDNKREIFKLVL